MSSGKTKNNIIKSNAEFNLHQFEQNTNHKSEDDLNANHSDKINNGFSAQFQFDETD